MSISTKIPQLLDKIYTSRMSWSLVDQGIVSVGNFLIVVLLAHSVPPADLGLYAVLFGIIQTSKALHNGLVEYPMTIFTAQREEPRRDVVGLSLLLSLPLFVLAQVAILGVVFVIEQMPLLFPVLSLAFFWQLQTFFRRALHAQLRYREATIGDAVCYFGQCSCAFAMMSIGNLTLEKALYAMAATAAAAALIQYIQTAPQYGLVTKCAEYIRKSWVLGVWVACSNVINAITTQSIGWILAVVYGYDATAGLRVVGNLVGATHPLMNGIRSMMVPSIAHAHRDGTQPALVTALRLSMAACCLVLPILIVLLVIPETILTMVYGDTAFYAGLGLLLQIFAVNYILRLVVLLCGSTLNGMSLSKKNFFVKVSGSLTTFVIGTPMAIAGGVLFAGVSYVLSNFIQLCVYVRMLKMVIAEKNIAAETILREALARPTLAPALPGGPSR